LSDSRQYVPKHLHIIKPSKALFAKWFVQKIGFVYLFFTLFFAYAINRYDDTSVSIAVLIIMISLLIYIAFYRYVNGILLFELLETGELLINSRRLDHHGDDLSAGIQLDKNDTELILLSGGARILPYLPNTYHCDVQSDVSEWYCATKKFLTGEEIVATEQPSQPQGVMKQLGVHCKKQFSRSALLADEIKGDR